MAQTVNTLQQQAERKAALSRRQFLRGVGGIVLSVPAFTSLAPRSLWAQSDKRAPLRMAFFSHPNGVVQTHWWPTGGEKDFVLGEGIKALRPYREYLQR